MQPTLTATLSPLSQVCACLAIAIWVAGTQPVTATSLFETFDVPLVTTDHRIFPEAYWYFTNTANPAQDAWTNIVTGDGTAHLTVTPTASEGDYQTIGFGKVGPGHRLEMRAKGALIPGYTGFLFTYAGCSSEIDIELVPVDRHAAVPHTPSAWSDVRLITYVEEDDSDATFMPILNAQGERVSQFEDDAYHIYTVDWLTNRVSFAIDGVHQRTVGPDFTPKLPAEVLVGLRRVKWAGACNWTGTRTMIIDWLYIHPLDANSPVAEPQTYGTVPATALEIEAPGLLANSHGVDLAAALVAPPEHGTVNLKPDGAFVYTPHPGFVGRDAFVYRATRGTTDDESNAAVVTIQVAAPLVAGPVHRQPLAALRGE